MEVLIINGNDYSKYVERKGLGWSRNDLDSENTVRVKSGTMRRNKVCTKRKLAFKMVDMAQDVLAQLDNDLSEATFVATYLDLHGVMERTFYCTSLSGTVTEVGSNDGETPMWADITFNLIEV